MKRTLIANPVPNLVGNFYNYHYEVSPLSTLDTNNEDELKGEFLLKSYLTYLRIIGLYFDDVDGLSFGKIYSIINLAVYILLFIWMVVTSALFVDDGGNFKNSAMFITQGIWMLQNCCIGLNCYRICRRGNFRRGFLKDWTAIYSSRTINAEIAEFARKSQKILIYLIGVIHVVNSATFIIVDFELVPGADTLFPSRKFLPPSILPFCQRVAGIFSAISIAPWSVGKCFFVIVCLNLNKLFEIYNRELHHAVCRPEGIDGKQIETLRLLHHRICHLVDTVEDHFSLFIFAAFLTNLGMIVSNTNAMLDTTTLNFEVILGLIWVGCDLVILGAMSIVGANTNGLAHECLQDLRVIHTRSLLPKNSLQLSLFMNKICQTTIGISGYGFFLLSKHFLANALSAYVSYYFLLVQMKPARNAMLMDAGNNISQNMSTAF